MEPGETLFFEEVLQRLREIYAIKMCVSFGKIVNLAAPNETAFRAIDDSKNCDNGVNVTVVTRTRQPLLSLQENPASKDATEEVCLFKLLMQDERQRGLIVWIRFIAKYCPHIIVPLACLCVYLRSLCLFNSVYEGSILINP